jgi:hypothetical protein
VTIQQADEDDLPSLADAPPEGSDVGNAAVPKDKTTEAKERGKVCVYDSLTPQSL